MTWASLEMPLSSTLILLVRSSATNTSTNEDGLREFKKNCTISTIREQSRYLTRDWVYTLCNLFWSMSRHNRSSSNLLECQLKPHCQTTPKLTHCPKTLRINHMKTSTYPHHAYQGGDLPSQGSSNLGRQEFGSGRFYASSLNFVPACNSFSGFDHQYSATFRQGVHDNMRTQRST
jgi:hypothetical protein